MAHSHTDVTPVTPTPPLPKPRKKVLPRVSVAARIERGYYEDLVRIIDADDHYNRFGDFVREAVLEKIDRWKKDHPLGGPSPRK
jgi:hypothetical protein